MKAAPFSPLFCWLVQQFQQGLCKYRPRGHTSVLDFSLSELLGRNNYAVRIIHGSIVQLPVPGAHSSCLQARGGFTLGKSPPHHRANIQRQTSIYTLIHTQRSINVTIHLSQRYMSLGCGRKSVHLKRTSTWGQHFLEMAAR